MFKFVNKKSKGFTLVELLVVVAIIAILSAAIVPKLLGYSEKARESRAMADLATMKSVVEIWTADEGHGTYPRTEKIDEPETDAIGDVLTEKGINWTGDKNGIQDPWGNAYEYVRVTDTEGDEGDKSNVGYCIASPGLDGNFGTDDDYYVTDANQPMKGKVTVKGIGDAASADKSYVEGEEPEA